MKKKLFIFQFLIFVFLSIGKKPNLTQKLYGWLALAGSAWKTCNVLIHFWTWLRQIFEKKQYLFNV